MTLTVYGIKNCSTMKKAFDWLEAAGIEYRFHDYRKLGAPHDQLLEWCARFGWEALINTRGTTWRKLPDSERVIRDNADAVARMCDKPSMIRRPIVVDADGDMVIGFDPEAFARIAGVPQ